MVSRPPVEPREEVGKGGAMFVDAVLVLAHGIIVAWARAGQRRLAGMWLQGREIEADGGRDRRLAP